MAMTITGISDYKTSLPLQRQKTQFLQGYQAPVLKQQACQAVRNQIVRQRSLAVRASLIQKADTYNNTYYPKLDDTLSLYKPWYIIDAKEQTLGRLASLVSQYLRGKNSPVYHPAMHMGNYVIVINADKVKVGGRKFTDKIYHKQGTIGQPGTMKVINFQRLFEKKPEKVIDLAVWGMMPKSRMGKKILKQFLKIYRGEEHDHQAQNPIDITYTINQKPTEIETPLAKIYKEEVKA